MLGIIRWPAVIFGVVLGTLTAGLVFSVMVLAANAVNSEIFTGLSISLAVVAGLFTGGFLAGRMAPVNGRFHGSITGLVLAGLVMVISRWGGSPASVATVLLLAVIAVVVGGIGGIFGYRRR